MFVSVNCKKGKKEMMEPSPEDCERSRNLSMANPVDMACVWKRRWGEMGRGAAAQVSAKS